MVEPFAKAAFAAKPYTIGDMVPTQFGDCMLLDMRLIVYEDKVEKIRLSREGKPVGIDPLDGD